MAGAGAVEVRARLAWTFWIGAILFPPLVVLAHLLFRPRVLIDGTPVPGTNWFGSSTVAVRAGRHELEAWGGAQGSSFSRQSVGIEVGSGRTVRVFYRSPLVRFGEGYLTVAGSPMFVRELYGLAVNDRVVHALWGTGTIRSIVVDEPAATSVAVVAFDTGEQRVDLDREEVEPA